MKRFRLKKLNNDGAALILAMVIVMFISILTTVLLYLSAMNYEMKTTDYRTRVSFYGAEVPLEELKVQLAVDASEAAKDAYRYVFSNYSIMNNEGVRASEFASAFYTNLEDIWTTRQGVGGNWVTSMKTALKANSGEANAHHYDVMFSTGTQDSAKSYHIILTAPNPTSGILGTRFERDEAHNRIFLRDVVVVYTENGFTSQIKTDFCIKVPEFEWGVNSYDNPVGGVSADAVKRKKINFESCVSYMDWQKQ